MKLPVRLLLFIACGLIGFFAAHGFAPALPATGQSPSADHSAKPSLKPLTGIPEESTLVAEWEQLRRDHGGDAADLAALYAAAKGTEDVHRRRAFLAATIAEWAMRDPNAALVHFSEKDSYLLPQLMREWLRIDPDAAITGALAGGTKARISMRSLQSEIAQLAPGRLAEVATALPKAESRGESSTQDAFATWAKEDAAAARAAAESVTGPMRAEALAGVATAWAEKDGPAALAWADLMPKGVARDAALRGVLIGWAKTDPVAALERIDLVPPGGDEMYFASDVGAQVLREAASRNWEATIQWLIDNPGKLGNASLNGLQGVLSQRLMKDPGATLRELGGLPEIGTKGLPGLSQIFSNAVLNEGYLARDAIWNWLDGQPPDSFTRGIRGMLLNAIAWKEPSAALEFLDKLPATGEDRQVIQRGTHSLLNGGQQMAMFEDFLENASPKVRPFLLQAGFRLGGEALGEDPQRWIERLAEVPEDQRADAVQGFARGWARVDPEAAVQWAIDLDEGPQRASALMSAAGGWAQADPDAAAAWVDTLPPGNSRDTAAQALVYSLARQRPETAWMWAVSIEAPAARMPALQSAYLSMHRVNPAAAEEMLQSGNLSIEEINTLKERPTIRSTPLMAPPMKTAQ